MTDSERAYLMELVRKTPHAFPCQYIAKLDARLTAAEAERESLRDDAAQLRRDLLSTRDDAARLTEHKSRLVQRINNLERGQETLLRERDEARAQAGDWNALCAHRDAWKRKEAETYGRYCKLTHGATTLMEQRDRLAAALREAREAVVDWAACTTEYEREKYNLEGDLTKIDAALAEIDGGKKKT